MTYLCLLSDDDDERVLCVFIQFILLYYAHADALLTHELWFP